MTTNHVSTPAPARVPLAAAVPEAYRALGGLYQATTTAAHAAGLPEGLIALVQLRVSQINGCAYCVDLHSQQARAAGESARRVDLVAVWPEAPCFDVRDRAAFRLAEAMTRLPDRALTDEAYAQAAADLTEPELAAIGWVVILINAFNRLAVTSRTPLPDRQDG